MSQQDSSREPRMYAGFAAMIAMSTTVIFVLAYSHTYGAEHVHPAGG